MAQLASMRDKLLNWYRMDWNSFGNNQILRL